MRKSATILIFIKLLWTSLLTLPILAQDEKLYGLNGEEVTLTPQKFSEKLDRILWKHGEDKAAEWDSGTKDYFRIFEGSASLDEITGILILRKLDAKFNGIYSAEINGKSATKRSTLTVISRVQTPGIKKLCNESYCTLFCETEPTTKGHYSWLLGEVETGNANSDLMLKKSDEVLDKAYKCNYSNPLSHALSDDIVPFSSAGQPIGLIAGIIAAILAVIVIAFAIIKRKELGLQELWRRITKGGASNNTTVNHSEANETAHAMLRNEGNNSAERTASLDDKL